jgi:hypothetical protein
MDKNRGWAPDDAANDGLEERKSETDRLNEKSNAEQQAASHPEKAPHKAVPTEPDTPA